MRVYGEESEAVGGVDAGRAGWALAVVIASVSPAIASERAPIERGEDVGELVGVRGRHQAGARRG